MGVWLFFRKEEILYLPDLTRLPYFTFLTNHDHIESFNGKKIEKREGVLVPHEMSEDREHVWEFFQNMLEKDIEDECVFRWHHYLKGTPVAF